MSDVKQAKSATERDTELSVAFVNAFYDDVSILDDIPNGSTLVLLPEDDSELAEINLQSGIEAARNGADVYIRHVTRARSTPQSSSASSEDTASTMRDEPIDTHFRPIDMDLETFAEYARDDLITNSRRYRRSAQSNSNSDKSKSSDLDERHIRLQFEFLSAFIDDPTILDDVPNKVTLALLANDDPEHFESSLQLAESAARRGADVYIRHFARNKPAPQLVYPLPAFKDQAR